MSDLEKELEAARSLITNHWGHVSKTDAHELALLITRALAALRESTEDTQLLDWLDARDGWINGLD